MSSDPFDFSDHHPPAAATPAAEPPWLADLNPMQRQAVEALDGPVLVLAGAGTGKTRVLTARIARLVQSGKAHPGSILAVTFTNKAAREMTDRIERLLHRPASGMAIGTFHSISARWLRDHAELVGLKSNFTILDTDDQIRLLKQIVKDADIDEKTWPAKVLAGLIDRWKNRALSPDKVPTGEAHGFADGKGLALYRRYQEQLKILNACDFGDLLLHMIDLFQSRPEVLRRYQARYRYLLVDEYQDTNVAQYLWLRLLAMDSKNICCVGDDDQSIYGWRGAEVGNILRFEKDFPGATVIRLEQNYRSTGHILGAASSLIAANADRLGKTLWTAADMGDRLDLIGVWDADEEARVVGERIEELQRAGDSLSEMAILVRAGFQTREFEERMITLGLPYRVVGGPRFYERAEIRDALAYLRVIHQQDDGLAFERIVNLPKRGLGDATMQSLHRLARLEGISLYRAAELLVESDELKPKARNALAALLADFARWRADLAAMEHHIVAGRVLEDSGYIAMWKKARTPDAGGRLDNLAELTRAMQDFASLGDFLEHVGLVMEMQADAGGARVSIMTLHAAKGLEFDHVFLPGWEEGIFPNQRAIDEGGLKSLEEERRLAYVGLTRAKKRAILLFAANRRVYGQWQASLPSRFLEEIKAEHLLRSSDQGLYRGPEAGRQVGFQGYDVEPSRGPGWDRARLRGLGAGGDPLSREDRIRRARRSQPIAEGRARVIDAASEASRFSEGERVFHDKFGYGQVTATEGGKIMVCFEHGGDKHVLQSFLRPA